MWRQHRRMFVLAGLLKLVHDIVMFLGPFVLEQLLKYLQRGGTICKSGLPSAEVLLHDTPVAPGVPTAGRLCMRVTFCED